MEQDLPNPPSSVEESPLPFLHLMSILKHVPRTGWLRTVSRPESVAAHTYRLAVICMLAPKPLNQERCIYLALCHDMAESVVGDIPTYAGVAKDTKHELEESGIHYIKDLLKTSHPSTSEKINEAWQEYEAGSTAEARWVREMDKFECLLQASEYERMTHGEKDLEEFQGLSRKIHSPIGIAWAMLLQQEREACVRKRRERVPIIFVVGYASAAVERQCALLSEELGFYDLSLEEVLQEKAHDATFRHAEYIRDCIGRKIPVPVQLAIAVLEMKISEGVKQEGRWSLLRGFPQNMQYLVEFQEQVQKTNYTLFLRCSTDASPQPTLGELTADAGSRFVVERGSYAHPRYSEVVDSLAGAKEYFTEVRTDGTMEEIHEQVKDAVKGFIEHATNGS